MITFKRPLLAASLLKPTDRHDDDTIFAAMQKLKYPVAATLKIDGIRALRLNGTLLSRRLKEIPNKSIRMRSLKLPGGFDMELYNPSMSYDEIDSIVMSRVHPRQDEIEFWVLDWYRDGSYTSRYFDIEEFVGCTFYEDIVVVVQDLTICSTPEQLFAFEKKCIQEHGEGICFRLLDSPYIQKNTTDNRSTLAEQYLVKLSRFVRAEARIIGFEEAQENANTSKVSELGSRKRSSHASGMYGKGTLGAFLVRTFTGIEFSVGSGSYLTKAKRQYIWNHRDEFLGKYIVYKYKPFNQLVKPRHPQCLGMRGEIDL